MPSVGNLSSQESPVPADSMPGHVAIIMDGNGRWAQQRGKPRVAGHRQGAKSVREIIQQSRKWGIKVLTLFAFSDENWGRPVDEVGVLMHLLEFYIKKERNELHAQNIKLHVIGDVTRLPKSLQALLRDAEKMLSGNTGMTLNLALSYGGRAEITRAMQSIGEMIASGEITSKEVTQELVSSKLYTFGLPDPDLIIRTSGEQRISNFLLWQAAYSELYFTNVFWPDFNSVEYAKAMHAFAARKRRFGLTDAQIADLSIDTVSQSNQDSLPC